MNKPKADNIKALLDQLVTNIQVPHHMGSSFSIEAKLEQLFDLASILPDISGTVEDNITLTLKVTNIGTFDYTTTNAGSLMRTILARMAFAIQKTKFPEQEKQIEEIIAKENNDKTSTELEKVTAIAHKIAAKRKEQQQDGFQRLNTYGFETTFEHAMKDSFIKLHVITRNQNGTPLSFYIARVEGTNETKTGL